MEHITCRCLTRGEFGAAAPGQFLDRASAEFEKGGVAMAVGLPCRKFFQACTRAGACRNREMPAGIGMFSRQVRLHMQQRTV